MPFNQPNKILALFWNFTNFGLLLGFGGNVKFISLCLINILYPKHDLCLHFDLHLGHKMADSSTGLMLMEEKEIDANYEI